MKTAIAILGATGVVGQKMIAMLGQFPEFEIAELVASPQNAGKKYSDACTWREFSPLPPQYSNMVLKNPIEITSTFVLSALPSDLAAEIEPMLAAKGHWVISNASTFRMHREVPLIIPEINPHHLRLIERQTTPGKIITNPNCSTVFLTMGLHPLRELGDIESVSVVTLQALSGAGYPGVSALDALGNIIPFINQEEDKIENESQKILGDLDLPASFGATVHVHRVPVLHGHTVAMHVSFKQDVRVEQAYTTFARLEKQLPEAYKLHTQNDRPQPARDLSDFDNRTHIGRLKQGHNNKTIGLIAMGHNLVRGAAGAAIANLQLVIQNFNGERI